MAVLPTSTLAPVASAGRLLPAGALCGLRRSPAHVPRPRRAEFTRRVLGQTVEMPLGSAPPERPGRRLPVAVPRRCPRDHRCERFMVHIFAEHGGQTADHTPGGVTHSRTWSRQLRVLAVDKSTAVGAEDEDPTAQPRFLQRRLRARTDLLGRRFEGDAQQRRAGTRPARRQRAAFHQGGEKSRGLREESGARVLVQPIGGRRRRQQRRLGQPGQEQCPSGPD